MKAFLRYLLTVFIGVLFSGVAVAVPVRYDVINSQFYAETSSVQSVSAVLTPVAGSLNGLFMFDPSSQTYGAVQLTVSGLGDTGLNQTYDSLLVTDSGGLVAASSSIGANVGDPGIGLLFYPDLGNPPYAADLSGALGSRLIRYSYVGYLTQVTTSIAISESNILEGTLEAAEAVPVPGGAVLLVSGLASLALIKRRRNGVRLRRQCLPPFFTRQRAKERTSPRLAHR
jgi:hypothetical protein